MGLSPCLADSMAEMAWWKSMEEQCCSPHDRQEAERDRRTQGQEYILSGETYSDEATLLNMGPLETV